MQRSGDTESEPTPAKHFKGRITVQPGKPIEISDSVEVQRPDAAKPEVDAIASTLALYQKAAKEFLAGEYRELGSVAPTHMRVVCDCWVVVCDDGIIVRWDKHEGDDKPKVRIAWPQEGPTTVEALAPGFSERYVFCPSDISNFELPTDGQQVRLVIGDSVTGEQRLVGEGVVAALVNWAAIKEQLPTNANRPIPIASISNELQIEIGGEEFDATAEPKRGTGNEFVATGRMRLAVGWEAIEIYPPFDSGVWRPEVARDWAQLDLLAASARHNLRQQQLNAIDPRAAARREYANRLKELQSLLDGLEGGVQTFLESNPELLSPTHAQMWRKIPLGARVTDFVFRELPSEYTLVELEAPVRTLFRRDGQQHEDLTHAINQALDWLRYVEDNLDTVQRELGLAGISSTPRCLIVIGRSAGLTEQDRRKLATIQRESPRLRILTYDDLLVTATQAVTNVLGSIPRTAEGVEIYYRWRR